MKLLNCDFYDLYALIIFFRADTDKVSEYAGAIEQMVTYLEEPILTKELKFNTVRKILRAHVSKAEKGLSWIWTENVYTGNVKIMKNIGYYHILIEIFREMLRSIGDSQRLWRLCDVTHNLPSVLVECNKPKKVIKSMFSTSCVKVC